MKPKNKSPPPLPARLPNSEISTPGPCLNFLKNARANLTFV